MAIAMWYPQRQSADLAGTAGGIMRPRGHDGSVSGWQVIQAMELTRALRVQLVEMTMWLAWLERQDVAGRKDRARARRIEAAELRRDINEAQLHIDRLQRRYLKIQLASIRPVSTPVLGPYGYERASRRAGTDRCGRASSCAKVRGVSARSRRRCRPARLRAI